jgi:hypothetical protein
LSQLAFDQRLDIRPRSVEVILGRERDTLLLAVNVVTQHPGRRGFYPLAFLLARSADAFHDLSDVH